MGDPNKELSEDDFDKFDAKRSEAMSVFSEGEWEKAIPIFTEAIEINATSGKFNKYGSLGSTRFAGHTRSADNRNCLVPRLGR